MQYQKLTGTQKVIRWKRMSFAKKVGELLAKHPDMLTHEAVRQVGASQKPKRHRKKRKSATRQSTPRNRAQELMREEDEANLSHLRQIAAHG